MNERRTPIAMVISAAAAVAVGLQLYLLANEISGGAVKSRLESTVGPWWRRVRHSWELEEQVARGTGHVIWEAMQALEEEAP